MIVVTCAVIRNEDMKVLIVQRGGKTDHPFKWEFPGGKLNKGETEEDCIVREIGEELSIDIVICGRLPEVVHDYGHKQIRLVPFICDTLADKPVLSEHVDYKWIDQDELLNYDYSDADVFVARSYSNGWKTENTPSKVTPPDEIKDDSDLQSMVNSIMSMKVADWVATYATENHAVFVKLLEYSLSSERYLAFRASWILTKACDKYPDLIYPYLPEIIEVLEKLDNESALRSLLRIISLSELKELKSSHHGLLADFCFNVLKSGDSAIAVKAYSMEILYKLSVIYPELANELSASIQLLLEDSTAGIKSRGHTILRKLSR